MSQHFITPTNRDHISLLLGTTNDRCQNNYKTDQRRTFYVELKRYL